MAKTDPHIRQGSPAVKGGKPVSVTFLGTSSGGGPIVSRNCSSLTLNMDGMSWLFDCAEGTQLQIQRSSLKLSRIERIFVTHMHADHTLGLVPLLGSLLSGIQTTPEDRAAMAALGLKKKAKLHIYGPPGLRLMVRQILNLTSMTLGDAYAVHELIPNKQSVTGEAFNSTSPNGNGNEPSCECKEADLQIAEAVGRDIHADKDGCWKDILKIGEGQHGNEAQSWRVDAGPIKHRVMSLGYIVTEPPTYEPLDLDSMLPMIESQFEALSKLTPPIRHPRQVTSILTKTLRPYTLPDGQILQPPVRAKTTPRKIVIFGDCCGTDNAAFLEMVKEPSLLVHEATNAWIDPELEFAGKAKGTSAAEDLADASSGEVEAAHRIAKDRVANRSKGRGHSDAETTGLFAKSIAAQRVAVNHFSAMFPSPKYAMDEPFQSLISPTLPLPPGRPAPPIHPGEISKRLITANIETQITDAWVGSSSGTTKLPRAVAARDLMTYAIPAHELLESERQIMHDANVETAKLEGIWKQGSAEGFVRETGVKLIGVWLDNQGNVSAPGAVSGHIAKGYNVGQVAEVDPVMNGLAAEGEVVAEVVGVTATGTPVSTTVTVVPSKKKQQRVGDSEGSFDRHPRRHVALLFVYQGWHYSGLAIQQMKTPLPTVEGELLKALEKTHLIEEGKGWDGCDLSRCGRTDRGVSSAGQVVTLWMKSKRRQGDGGLPLNVGGDWREAKNPVVKKENPVSPDGEDESTESWKEKVARRIAGQPTTYSEEELSKMNARQRQKALKRLQEGQTPSSTSVTEFSYPQILNRVLPPEIRILAWSPLPWSADDPPADPERPDQPPVDARFSCTTRHYKYFFTRRPIPDHPPLDIERMREAASLLVGEHDFRNFCKVDGSKQIDNHARRVDMAVIRKDGRTEMADDYNPETSEEESEGEGEEYVFELIGSAFLWHQVRHIMSVLFHVGHGFESPSIVSRLLHTGYPTPAALASGTVTLEEGQLRVNDPSAVGAKPQYNMGAALPLQLYQCGYPEGLIDWRYEGFDGPVDKVRTTDQEVRTKAGEGSGTVLNFLKSQVEEARVKARQIEAFYNESVRINRPEGLGGDSKVITEGETGTSYTLGAGENYSGRKYVPFLERPRGDPVELQNKRWREGKGENRRLRKLAEKEEAGPEGDKEK